MGVLTASPGVESVSLRRWLWIWLYPEADLANVCNGSKTDATPMAALGGKRTLP
jgi:hypothetical protein